MPVSVAQPLKVFTQDEYHAIDRVVTGTAFEIQNEFGRYMDEELYQAAMAATLVAKGLTVTRELKITLTLDTFRKDYFADLVLNGGVIVETKAAEALTGAHKSQVLNYLYLCGLHHATLLNMRPERVQREFVSTSLTEEHRRALIWHTAKWRPMGPGCEVLKRTLVRALKDWGARLEVAAYKDLAIHMFGGEDSVIRRVPVRSEHGVIGQQRLCLLAEDVAFSITASMKNPQGTLEHQRRFLSHTPLRGIQWVNLNGQDITFETILRPE